MKCFWAQTYISPPVHALADPSSFQTTLHSFLSLFLLSAFNIIVRKMEWVVWAGKLVAKIGVKMALNACQGGVGSVFEFAEATKCFYYGDVLGGSTCVVSGIADVYTFGLVGAIESGMKESAKESVVQFAKETAKSGSKEASKKVGQQVAKELAKGVIPSAVEEVWFEGTKMTWNKILQVTGLSVVSSGGHEVGKTVFEDGIQLLITEMLNRKPLEAAFEFTKEAAKQGAKTEFMNQSYRLLVKDLNVALLKGGINRYNHPLPPPLTEFESLTGNNGPNLLVPLEELFRRRIFEGHIEEYCP